METLLTHHPFTLVDVFAESPFSGNPLAVVTGGEGLTTEEMLRITAWFNLSETTFLLAPTHPRADYRVRIFTPGRELPFAGHPTLGTCHTWLEAGGTPKAGDAIVQECGAGLIPIRRDGKALAFAAPPRTRTGPLDPDTLADVCAALQISPQDVVAHEWLINGPTWAGVMLKSAEAVRAVRPLGNWPVTLDVGVVGPWPDAHDAAGPHWEVRGIFTNAQGTLIEDPATGSLNAGIAQWLLGNDTAHAPYVAGQGHCIGRDSRIHVSRDAEGAIWIGGGTVTLVEGTAMLP